MKKLWGAEVKAGENYILNFPPFKGRLCITRVAVGTSTPYPSYSLGVHAAAVGTFEQEKRWRGGYVRIQNCHTDHHLSEEMDMYASYLLATLGSQNNLGWSTLKAIDGEETRATLCTLHPMIKPTCSLRIKLEGENSVTFSVDGTDSICLSGYYVRTKAMNCTVARPALLKRTHHEMPDRTGEIKKSKRDEGKTCHDSNDHQSNRQERNDGYKKTNDAPPSPFQNTLTVVKHPNGTASSSMFHTKSQNDIHEISDDEKETTSKAKEEDGLTIETLTKGCAGAKVATVGSEVRVAYVGQLMNGDVFDEGSFQFMLGAGKVIRGWDLGIEDMLVGEERRLSIPPALGYGELEQVKIPSNSWLIYTIKLLEVEQTKRAKGVSTV